MSRGRKRKDYDRGGEREEQFEGALMSFSSNLYGELVSSTDATRFLRVVQREEDNWMAVLAITTEEGDDLVAFGNGDTFVMALQGLAGSLASDTWSDDKYADKRRK